MSVVELNVGNFEQEVLKSDKPVLVDFWAQWCGPCKMLTPIISQIAKQREDIKVCKLDIDSAQDIAAKYSVMTIPTVIAFSNGKELDRTVGVVPIQSIVNMVKV